MLGEASRKYAYGTHVASDRRKHGERVVGARRFEIDTACAGASASVHAGFDSAVVGRARSPSSAA